MRLYKPPCGHLHFPTPFTQEMELELPRALRLHTRGCGNGGMWVDVDFPAPHVMYLCRGRKTFARAHSLLVGHVLQFKLMESSLLSVEIFGCSGILLGCCAESSTGGESASMSESDKEDSDGDDDGSGQEGDDSDFG